MSEATKAVDTADVMADVEQVGEMGGTRIPDADASPPPMPTLPAAEKVEPIKPVEKGRYSSVAEMQVAMSSPEFLTELLDGLYKRVAALEALLTEFREWQQNKPGKTHRCVQHISADAAALLTPHPTSAPNRETPPDGS
jgi:hypothetical protein